jgi:hypothetical protein
VHNSETIYVDLDHPERNCHVLVFKYTNLIHSNNVYNCFAIMLFCDSRDVRSNNFSAVLIDDKSILITFPCMTYGTMHDSAERNECLKKQQLHCPLLQLSQDMNISDIMKDDKRNKRRILLVFPPSVVLANVFKPTSATIKYALHTNKAPNKRTGADPYITCHVVWRVVDMVTQRRAIVDAADEDDMDVIAKQLASM